MSQFIVPITSLPPVTSLEALQSGEGTAKTIGTGNFFEHLQNALGDVAATEKQSSVTMQDLAFGGSDDLHTGAIAALKASTAVNFTTSLVSRAIASYNEIIRMQI